MDLHIFNPEHEIALAYNRNSVTAPHNVQEFRMNLGWMPALWANDGDVVLVDDSEYAVKAASRMKEYTADVLFLQEGELGGLAFDKIRPWGWNAALRSLLRRAGVKSESIPSSAQLDAIRDLSSRQQVPTALDFIRRELPVATCGECRYTTSADDIAGHIARHGKTVLKAPWSCSGRGVRYISSPDDDATMRWARNVVASQGGIMMEPYYNKVTDFAMEFEAKGSGVDYCGLSIFHTVNGTYKGNIIATEEEKHEAITRYVDARALGAVASRICEYMASLTKGVYEGPFGVDMMVVAGDNAKGFLLHPCVEINLRRTMGHVALSLSRDDDKPRRLMQTVHNVNYQLKISELENNFVQII